MEKLIVPARLKKEFRTVEALWNLDATTPYLDALILSWVKYEKQLRKLFGFLMYQHPFATDDTRKDIELAIASNKKLYPESLSREIEAIGGKPISKLVGPSHDDLSKKLKKIGKYRDKIMHGQVSGGDIKAEELRTDILTLSTG